MGSSRRGSFEAVGEAHLVDKHIGGGWVCVWSVEGKEK